MPLAVLHRLRIDDHTTRRFSLYTPEVPAVLAGFSGLSQDKIILESTGIVHEVNTKERWQNQVRVRSKCCKAQYGSNNPNVEPAGWTEAWRSAEREALALMEARDRSREKRKANAKANTKAPSPSKPVARKPAAPAADDALAAMTGGAIPPFQG